MDRLLVLFVGAALAAGARAKVPEFTEMVRKDAASGKYCADAAEGDVCRMSHPDAVKYCAETAGGLPMTRAFGMYAQAQGSKGLLEVADVEKRLKGVLPEGYYKVDAENGDTFYFNNAGYKAPEGPMGTESFWTASIVTKKPQYAHVYYGKLGGGGGTPEEHRLDYRHAVVCLAKKAKRRS